MHKIQSSDLQIDNSIFITNQYSKIISGYRRKPKRLTTAMPSVCPTRHEHRKRQINYET